MRPENLFLERYRYCNDLLEKAFLGIVPEKELLLISMYAMYSRSNKDAGRVPSMLLLGRFKPRRDSILFISDGILPVKFLRSESKIRKDVSSLVKVNIKPRSLLTHINGHDFQRFIANNT